MFVCVLRLYYSKTTIYAKCLYTDEPYANLTTHTHIYKKDSTQKGVEKK